MSTRRESSDKDFHIKGGLRGGIAHNFAHYLEGTEFPCSRDDLVKQAENNKAVPGILDSIKHLPEKNYPDLKEVMHELSNQRS